MNTIEPRCEADLTALKICTERHSARAAAAPKSAWPGNSAGFVLVSVLLHVGAIASLAHPAVRQAWRWELRLPSGKNSVALSASIAGPPSDAAVPMKIVLPETTATEEPVERREAELPDRAAAVFASSVEDVRRPLPRAMAAATTQEVVPERNEPESPRPKRTAEARLPDRELARPIESPNSSPSTASTGAEVQRSPKELVRVEPVYPAAALSAGHEGTVRLHVKVNARGEVVAADLYQSSGYPLLDQAALDVIYRWQYSSPTEAEGIAAEFVQPLQFRIRR